MNNLYGGNLTDIDQHTAMKLICNYYKNVNKLNDMNVVFIGDVHGDMNQFMMPLVHAGLIKLNGDVNVIESKHQEANIYVPSYEICETNTKIIYLGDMIDEFIFSRTIVVMLKHLLTNTKNVIYIYGNHDLSVIGRYFLFKSHQLNVAEDIPTLWTTLKSELNCHKNVKIYKNIIEYNGSIEDGQSFLYEYLEPLFDGLYEIFVKMMGRISLPCNINGKNYIISHTTWTRNAIKALIGEHDSIKRDRPNDANTIQHEVIINDYKASDEHVRFLKSISETTTDIDYVMMSKAVNDVFYSKSRLFVSKNNLTYTRNTDKIFLNHIVGHTPGYYFREINVNNDSSITNKERESKLKPYIINNVEVYYFDFLASSGCDHDEISRPDYVYVTNNTLHVSDLPLFKFEFKNNEFKLISYDHKNLYTNKKT